MDGLEEAIIIVNANVIITVTKCCMTAAVEA